MWRVRVPAGAPGRYVRSQAELITRHARYAAPVTDLGTLQWRPILDAPALVSDTVVHALRLVPSARAAEIDPAFADTAAFCEAYDVAPENSANCVVVVGRRGGETRYAAVMVLATMRADVNGVIRRELDVRKCSFAPMDEAVALTEHGVRRHHAHRPA